MVVYAVRLLRKLGLIVTDTVWNSTVDLLVCVSDLVGLFVLETVFC